METYRVGDHDVTFDPSEHRYWVDGIEVASVSQIVQTIHPRKTKNIDPEILKKAAQRGNELHDMIEHYERHGIKTYHPEMQSYLALKTQHQFDVMESEPLVLLHVDGAVIGAGRFDMVVRSPYIKGEGIADVKRMAHLDEQRLRLQLNLYKLAYEQTYKRKISYLKCIHIRNRHHRYVDILIDKTLAKDALDAYLEKHPIDFRAYL